MTWNAQLPNGTASDSLYAFAPATATVAAGATSTIVVTPAGIPQSPVNTAPSAFGDTITITTDIANDTAHPVALSETPLGDILSVQPTSLPFGANPINTSTAPQTFVVVNDANPGSPTASVTITSSDATDFPISTATATAAAGGGSSNPISVQFNAPGTPNAYHSNINIATSDVLCAPLPASPMVEATGTATQAGPSYSASSLNFNLVNCGATAPPQQITAGNTGTQSYTITGPHARQDGVELLHGRHGPEQRRRGTGRPGHHHGHAVRDPVDAHPGSGQRHVQRRPDHRDQRQRDQPEHRRASVDGRAGHHHHEQPGQHQLGVRHGQLRVDRLLQQPHQEHGQRRPRR